MKTNSQPPEKKVGGGITWDGSYAVNSIFHTIQGEGPFAGEPAVFIRLAGCNLQCPKCDTEYTSRTAMTAAEICDASWGAVPQHGESAKENGPPYRWERFKCGLVVITGGEPFRQPIGSLVRALVETGYRVQIETNGSFAPDMNFPFGYLRNGSPRPSAQRVWIVCSPKTGKVSPWLLPGIDAFKYVASVESLKDSPDGLPMRALGHPASPMLYRPPVEHSALIFLQPEDEGHDYPNALNRKAVVESCLKYGHRLCIQTHKLIGVP